MRVKRFFELAVMLMLALLASTPSAAGGASAPSAAGGAQQAGLRQAQPPTYQVVRGDSWTGVAWRTGTPICALAAANGHVRCSSIYRASSALMVGQTLEVPDGR